MHTHSGLMHFVTNSRPFQGDFPGWDKYMTVEHSPPGEGPESRGDSGLPCWHCAEGCGYEHTVPAGRHATLPGLLLREELCWHTSVCLAVRLSLESLRESLGVCQVDAGEP